jgi:hypothetical protein
MTVHDTRTHNSWAGAKQRCNDPNHRSYKHYGEKGIRVCKEWAAPGTGYAAFYAHMGPKPEGHTLDRIDRFKDYEPDNCRWATYVEQNRDRSTVRLYPYDGEMLTIPELAALYDLKPNTLYWRLVTKGMDLDDALTHEKHTWYKK